MPDKKEAKAERSSSKLDVGSMIGRIYRLRVLQGRIGEPATIYRYEEEERRIMAELKKAGMKEEAVEKEIDKLLE